MSPLAAAVYRILRTRLAEGDPRITYAELARRLRDKNDAFEHITHRSQQLYAALCDVGSFCKQLRLPPLPALVVRADTRRPGDAYYEACCQIDVGRMSLTAALPAPPAPPAPRRPRKQRRWPTRAATCR